MIATAPLTTTHYILLALSALAGYLLRHRLASMGGAPVAPAPQTPTGPVAPQGQPAAGSFGAKHPLLAHLWDAAEGQLLAALQGTTQQLASGVTGLPPLPGTIIPAPLSNTHPAASIVPAAVQPTLNYPVVTPSLSNQGGVPASAPAVPSGPTGPG